MAVCESACTIAISLLGILLVLFRGPLVCVLVLVLVRILMNMT